MLCAPMNNVWRIPQCGHMVEQEVMRGQLSADSTEVRVSASCERSESRFAQVKRILAGTLHTGIRSSVQCANNHQTPLQICEDNSKDEACKPRKRKERHESIGSISQERKVVSSHVPTFSYAYCIRRKNVCKAMPCV